MAKSNKQDQFKNVLNTLGDTKISFKDAIKVLKTIYPNQLTIKRIDAEGKDNGKTKDEA